MERVTRVLSNLFLRIFGGTYVAQKCGHKTKLAGSFTALGQKHSGKIEPENGKVDYCIECIGKMTIRCAWCGQPITIGDPITLYTPVRKDFKIPDYAVVYLQDPLQLVGCLRWNCADTGGDRAGFWMPPGQVMRVLSPIEQVMLAADNGEEKIVVVNDTRDIKEALRAPW